MQHVHAVCGQLLCVSRAIVAQRVQFCRDDQRWGHAAMGGSQQGRGLRMSGMCFLTIQIEAHVLGHLFGGQWRALGVVVQRGVQGMEAAA